MEPNRPAGRASLLPNFVARIIRAIARFLGWQVTAVDVMNQMPRGEVPERQPTSLYARNVINLANKTCSTKISETTYPDLEYLEDLPEEQLTALFIADAKMGGELFKRYYHEDSDVVGRCLQKLDKKDLKQVFLTWSRNKQVTTADDIPLLWKLMNSAFPEGFSYFDPDYQVETRYIPFTMVAACIGAEFTPACTNKLIAEREAAGEMKFGELISRVTNDLAFPHAGGLFTRQDELGFSYKLQACRESAWWKRVGKSQSE